MNNLMGKTDLSKEMDAANEIGVRAAKRKKYKKITAGVQLAGRRGQQRVKPLEHPPARGPTGIVGVLIAVPRDS